VCDLFLFLQTGVFVCVTYFSLYGVTQAWEAVRYLPSSSSNNLALARLTLLLVLVLVLLLLLLLLLLLGGCAVPAQQQLE